MKESKEPQYLKNIETAPSMCGAMKPSMRQGAYMKSGINMSPMAAIAAAKMIKKAAKKSGLFQKSPICKHNQSK